MLNMDPKTAALLHHTELSPHDIHKLIEVYVDDFAPMLQTHSYDEVVHITRALLHAINDIFPPPDLTNSHLAHPISIKKLIEEGAWSTEKELLGWVFNGVERTISITDEKYTKLLTQLNALINQPRVQLKHFEKLKGKLNWLSDAIVTGKPLLGDLDDFFHRQIDSTKRWTTLPTHIIQSLKDWRTLIQHLHKRPTSVFELVPTKPAYKGTNDASNWGAGGVWFSGLLHLLPLVWFVDWPDEIIALRQQNKISIAVLELVAILIQWLVLEHAVPREHLHHVSVATKADNTVAVSWTNKYRCSRDPTANRILKVLTNRLRTVGAAPFNVDHITGIHNVMADVASRPHSTNPKRFLASFSKTFPPPQNDCWHLCTLPQKLVKRIFSLILTPPSTLESWSQLTLNGAVFGSIGRRSWTPTTTLSTTTFQTLTTNNKSHCWVPSHNMYDMDTTNLDQIPGKQVQRQLRWRYAPSPRPLHWTEGRRHWLQRKENTTSQSSAN